MKQQDDSYNQHFYPIKTKHGYVYYKNSLSGQLLSPLGQTKCIDIIYDHFSDQDICQTNYSFDIFFVTSFLSCSHILRKNIVIGIGCAALGIPIALINYFNSFTTLPTYEEIPDEIKSMIEATEQQNLDIDTTGKTDCYSDEI